MSVQTLSDIVHSVMDKRNLSAQQVAQACGVAYQSVRNILEGKSVSVRFVTTFADAFEIEDRNAVQALLMAFLRLHCEDERGQELLSKAGWLDANP